MTQQELRNVKFGDILYCNRFNNADGSPARYKVNGKVRTWKRSPDRIEVPVKRGLYEYGTLTLEHAEWFELTEEEAKA
jgi:hypothetical protein